MPDHHLPEVDGIAAFAGHEFVSETWGTWAYVAFVLGAVSLAFSAVSADLVPRSVADGVAGVSAAGTIAAALGALVLWKRAQRPIQIFIVAGTTPLEVSTLGRRASGLHTRLWVFSEAGFTDAALRRADELGARCFAPSGDDFVSVRVPDRTAPPLAA